MDLIKRFEEYMRDFELTMADGNWGRIREHLTDDFVQERDLRPLMIYRDEGADLAIERWAADIEHLDKQFDKRIFIPLGSPVAEGNTVRLRWILLLVLEQSQTFIDEGVEVAEYRDDKICRLGGDYHPFTIERMKTWSQEYGHLVPKANEYYAKHRGLGSV